MILFRPLIRYADFKGRASRAEYWLFGVLQGFWYALLIGLAVISMGHGDPDRATTGVMIALGLMVLSMAALIVPNYAVLVRRLHDSGRGAIWLSLMAPNVLSSVMTISTITTLVSSGAMSADRNAVLGATLTGLGAAGVLGLAGVVSQGVLAILTLLPGTRGDNDFGPDPRDPGQRYQGDGASSLDEARLDALFAEAKRANGIEHVPYTPVFDFGPDPAAPGPAQMQRPTVDWGAPAPANGIAPRRRPSAVGAPRRRQP